MSDLVPYNPGGPPSRTTRRTARALERVHASQQIAAAYELARVEVIAEVTEAAMLAVSHVSAVESLLADRVPHAEGRLHQIANAGAIGLTEVVIQTGRRFR